MIQSRLQKGSLKVFAPFFELVGSMAEGTRIGLANELDLGLKFETWMNQPPFMVDNDPFSLKKAPASPEFMEEFFSGNVFRFHKFKYFLLAEVEKAIDDIYEEEINPPKLRRVTTNKDWNEGRTPCNGECKKKLEQRDFEQCEKCAVTVSQTKSGVALQFEWHYTKNKRIYCSIDLIPVFHILRIPTMKLTKLINEHMLCENPPEGWLSFLFKYLKEYKIILELTECGSGYVISVGLKTMSFLMERNHHIKPAQEFTENKFSSERMKEVYGCIKFLKKVLHLDLSSYWVKKELLREEYQSILDSCTTGHGKEDDFALLQVLSQPQLKAKLVEKIDFQESHKCGSIILKR